MATFYLFLFDAACDGVPAAPKGCLLVGFMKLKTSQNHAFGDAASLLLLLLFVVIVVVTVPGGDAVFLFFFCVRYVLFQVMSQEK